MTMKTIPCVVSALLLFSVPCLAGFDDGKSGTDYFETHIRPVLVDYCYECHSSESDEPAGGLLLDTRQGLRRGGETGPAIVPGETSESLLISAIEYNDLEMPPNEQLSTDQVARFRKWIEMGAPDPRNEDSPPKDEPKSEAAENPLWSLEPVANPVPPSLTDSRWPLNGIDHFVLARLHENGLQPVSEAQPAALLRRLSFDLVGLPPSVDELNDVTSGFSEETWQQEIDRLLDSSHFGERWARHWLDVARYGESAGSSRDVLMLYSWRYRDYVIDAFNNDLPYGDFVRQQIAGDLLNTDDPRQRRTNRIATGLLAIGSKSLNGGNLNLDIADDQIDVVSRAVMGLTVSCARCHDHKYDPVPTADYYALASIFRSVKTFYGGTTRRPKNITDQLKVYFPLNDSFDPASKQRKALASKITAAEQHVKRLAKRETAAKKKLPAGWQDILAASNAGAVDARPEMAAIKAFQDAVARHAEAVDTLQTLQAEQQQLPQPEFAFAVADDSKPKDWPIQVRGDKARNGDIAPRGFLTCVNLPDEFAIPNDQSGRLQLAEWMTHEQHPLTSRVIVNRVWQHLFGRGIVRSVDNFGNSGERPTHPQLLDWLAHRFVHQHQWSLKSLIREIVSSRTYRLSTENNADAWSSDPSNDLFWRMNRRRLDAEAIRDAMLVVSGNLVPNRPEGSLVQDIGEGEVGRNINTKPLEQPFPYRSVYLPIIRGLLPEVLKVFDFPEPSNPQGQRIVTNVPTQSLFLLNSPFVIEQANGIAARTLQSASDASSRITFLWMTTLGRPANAEEMKTAMNFLHDSVVDDPSSGNTNAGNTKINRPTGTTAQNTTANSTTESDTMAPDGAAQKRWALLAQSLMASAEFRLLD